VDDLRTFLDLLNETLAAAIVVVSASLLLYNLTRNSRDRVTRTSSIVLGCVTAVYIGDVLISLGPGLGTFEALLRFQWVGLAFIPAAMFHLSDALLATTGLPSRGRRRRASRVLYCTGLIFLLLAAFTDLLIEPVNYGNLISLRAGVVFPIYFLYLIVAVGVAFINVQRARNRCVMRSTQRRMGYLQSAMLTPVIGIFPYSVLLGPGQEYKLAALVLVNPDRVVKAGLLRFVLRGPATGLLALVVIIYMGPATDLLAIPGEKFMPFVVVAVILLWQWTIDLALPWLEKQLIYRDEDDEHMGMLARLTERPLSHGDLMQLIEAILEATCDYLQVSRALVASLIDGRPELILTIGNVESAEDWFDQNAIAAVVTDLQPTGPINGRLIYRRWSDFWILPLYSRRSASGLALIGMIGMEARTDGVDLTPDEEQMLYTLVRRAARTLSDLLLQSEVYAALEGLLPQFTVTRTRTAEVEYRPGRTPAPPIDGLPDRAVVIEQVHAALRHYWGGPGLTRSGLLELNIVRNMLTDGNDNPVRVLRDILLQAIEKQRPESQRDMRSPEWTLYNILALRFLEKKKARETALRLYMSEANLYRKQNIAIEAVADTILALERDTL
jgi:hypothetical protein